MSGIALKFTSLVIRTIAKPLAGALKAQAKEHEVFKSACITLAQTLHMADVKMRMRLLGENKIKVRPLNDKKAVENGANFLLEAFIFLVAGLLILYESYRSRVKANNEKATVKNDISELQDDISQMKVLMERLTDDIERLTASTDVATATVPFKKNPPNASSEGPRSQGDITTAVYRPLKMPSTTSSDSTSPTLTTAINTAAST